MHREDKKSETTKKRSFTPFLFYFGRLYIVVSGTNKRRRRERKKETSLYFLLDINEEWTFWMLFHFSALFTDETLCEESLLVTVKVGKVARQVQKDINRRFISHAACSMGLQYALHLIKTLLLYVVTLFLKTYILC